MDETIIFQWKMILLPLAAFFYIEFLKHLNQWHAARQPSSDEDYLAVEARAKSISEYDIFHIAAQTWRISKMRVDDDFKDYLIRGFMPHYVRDYVRRARNAAGR